jgi:hypothetical protein
MQHKIATGNGFGPALIRIEVGSEERDAIRTASRAALPQHGFHLDSACHIAHRCTNLMTGCEQMNQAVGT